MWGVARFTDVRAVLLDRQTYRSSAGAGPGGLPWGSRLEPCAPDHTRLCPATTPILAGRTLVGLADRYLAVADDLWCLARHPDRFAQLRADPDLAGSAFEEVLRFEPPTPVVVRTAVRAAEISAIPIDEGSRLLLFVGAAGRDPRQWSHADRFDITRAGPDHLAFGCGANACVGATMTRLGGTALLTAMARRVSSIERAAAPRRMLGNSLRGFESLPLRLRR